MAIDLEHRQVVIVGGGPVGALLGAELVSRGVVVEIIERQSDPRTKEHRVGHSFNLTLSRRGLANLPDDLHRQLYEIGVALPHRVVHLPTGAVEYQPYGSSDDEHLLSVSRNRLHEVFLDHAESRGAQIRFGREAVRVDPVNGVVDLMDPTGNCERISAALVVGADGANSCVRHAIARSGGRLRVSQEFIADGFTEISLPPTPEGEFAILERWRGADPRSHRHGLHIWPRGGFMLMSQPNVDHSYTTSLWMPMTSSDGPSWETLRSVGDAKALLLDNFRDVIDLMPDAAEEIAKSQPGSLRTVNCSPFYYERAVLVGDAAHTLVPYFGQGINCSFEDVSSLVTNLDGLRNHLPITPALAKALPIYSAERVPAAHAISEMSLGNGSVLKDRTADPDYLKRCELERRLAQERPDLFSRLYHAVAFTTRPYQEVLATAIDQQRLLDEVVETVGLDGDLRATARAFVKRCDPGSLVTSRDDAESDRFDGLELELSAEQRLSLLNDVATRILDHQRAVAEGDVPANYPDPVGMPARELPVEGTPQHEVLDELFTRALPQGMVHTHEGFMAHIPSGGLFQSAVGEFISRSANAFAGAWAAAPGLVDIEQQVVRWFCEIAGYEEQSFGYLTTGGSIANLMGVRCGLEARGETFDEAAAVLYVADSAHFSVQRAARIAGIPPTRVRVLETGPDDRMRPVDLLRQITLDREAGHSPAIVCATAGTTNIGAVDDLETLARVCQEEGLWLHVDACYGGFFSLTDRGRHLLTGLSKADSIAVDAHKSLFLPHGNSALLVKDKATLRQAFQISTAAYIPELADEEERPDFMQYGPEVTREVRGLSAWLPLRMHGIRPFVAALDRSLDLAHTLALRLADLDGVSVYPRGSNHLPTVLFRVDQRDDRAPSGDLTIEVCERLCALGNVYISTTEVEGWGVAMRVCLLNHRTDEHVLDVLVRDLRTVLLDVELATSAELARCSA